MSSCKCKYCIHHCLEYSPIYSTYIDGCKAPKDVDFSDGCKNVYKKKEPSKAFIKRRKTNEMSFQSWG